MMSSRMPRNTLLDFFEDFASKDEPFIVHDDGYRTREMSYRDLADASRRFAAKIGRAGIRANDKVVIWSENRGEWLIALWGSLLAGVVVVPVDYRASAELLRRITEIVGAKVVLVGTEVHAPEGLPAPVWPLTEARPLARSSGHGASGGHRVRDPRRDHLHERRDRRSERRDDHAPQRAREHHPDRARN